MKDLLKNLILIFSIIVLISCKENTKNDDVFVPLTISSSEQITIKLSKIVNIGTLDIQEETTLIDKDTLFKINPKPEKLTLCFLLANNAMSAFYIGPGMERNIVIKKNEDNEITFVFDKKDQVNNFTNSFHEQIKPLFNYTLTEKQLLELINKVEKKALNQLQGIKTTIDKVSYKILKSMVTGKIAHIKFMQGERFKSLTASSPYYDFVETIQFDDDNYLTYSDNLNTVHSVLEMRYERKYQKSFDMANNKFEFINTSIKNKEVKSAIICFFAGKTIPEQSEKEKEELLKNLTQLNIENKYIQHLKNIEAGTAIGAKIGSKAKYFELLISYDKEFSINQFEGKIIYVDNWATWCGPCMKSMKHFKEKQELLEEMDDVVFVFVSFDRNENIWRNYITKSLKLNQNIIHLYNGQEMNSNYTKYYNIKELPNYFVIDKQGLIKDVNPKTPSETDFITYLNQLSK